MIATNASYAFMAIIFILSTARRPGSKGDTCLILFLILALGWIGLPLNDSQQKGTNFISSVDVQLHMSGF